MSENKPLSERASDVWLLDSAIPKWVLDELAALEKRLAEAKQLYMELLDAVARKYPNETRHETALRYIMERESREVPGPHQDNPKHGLAGSCT